MAGESTRPPRLWRQAPLFDVVDDPETLPPPDRLARAGVVCLTCGADVATGEPHSPACDARHGPYCPAWTGEYDPDVH
jgi:hypothetical protein